VLIPGELKSRRHINLPGVKVNLPSFTEKDRADSLVGLEEGIDFLALSFVREAADIELLRGLPHRAKIQGADHCQDRGPNRHRESR
jgi:pyruvate kinase